MKNKKALYILLPAVVFIWGYVIFKIISGTRNNDAEFSYQTSIDDFFEEKLERDTFYIIANYKDPFIRKKPKVAGEDASKAKENVTVQDYRRNNNTRNTHTRQRRIRWPNIEYTGKVDSEKEITVFVKINNKTRLMSQDDSFDEVTLLKIYEDSIRVMYMDQEKTFMKK